MVSACCRVVLPPLWHIITPPFTPYHVIPNRPDPAALRAGSLWMAAWADAPLDGVETHPNLVGLGVVDCLPPGFAAAAYRAAGLSICQRRGILSVTTSAPPRLAPGVPGHHVSVLSPALALHRRVGRPCRHHPPCHSDAAAVAGETVAQAGSPG